MLQAHPKNMTDGSLLKRFRAGHDDAATELYRRYATRLHNLARRECASGLARRVDADDIVQSVFCAFFDRARKGFYDIPAGEDLWQLLLVIALNKVRSKRTYHKAARRDIRLTASGEQLEACTTTATPEAQLVRLAFHDALDCLSEQEKHMVELLMDGHEVSEIAAHVGRSKRTVERSLQAVRRRLGLILEAEHDE